MLVYTATKSEFVADVQSNRIEAKILAEFQSRLGFSTGASEIAAWRNSMQYMQNVLLDDGIPDDSGVAIEYRIPMTAKRIDFILTGRDGSDRESVVIIELKQWSEATSTPLDAIVETFVGGGMREVAHPSYQAWTYAALLDDFNQEVQNSDLRLAPCAYLHNLEDGSSLREEHYREHLDRAPLFIRSDVDRLARFIKNYVRKGDRDDLLYRIDQGRIRPSKNLADSLSSLLEGNTEFHMIDDQKVVYEKALELAAKAAEGEKQVLIVEGGPGTGKSVVAINLLVELTRRLKTTQYVTRNAAPRAVYKSKLTGTMTGTRFDNLFRSSGGFMESEPDVFDCLIVDEAHRLNEKSGLYQNLGVNQVKELIDASRSTVFFVDDRQRVTLKDIGTASEIRHWAAIAGAEVTELKLASQFRCNGSDGYLAWLDNALQIESTAVETLEGIDFDFRVVDSAAELRDLILDRNVADNKARLVAGYCWPWASKKNPAAMDIELEDGAFRMQWNLTRDGGNWIMMPDSVEQVGCIHTCQGLELDYVGVILGPDLVVRNGEVVTDATERASQDRSVFGYKKRSREDPVGMARLAAEIIKNTYRTLMTRGQKGCYVHSVDPETNAYLKDAIGSRVLGNAESEVEPLHPFPVVSGEELRPWENAVPLYDLQVAAGALSEATEPEVLDWVALPEHYRISEGLFVARVVGESMNRRVANGSWCLFKAHPTGSRAGRVVLAQHREISDPELGGQYTLKLYEGGPALDESGSRSGSVILRPMSTDSRFQPLVLSQEVAEGLSVLAELLGVLLPGSSR